MLDPQSPVTSDAFNSDVHPGLLNGPPRRRVPIPVAVQAVMRPDDEAKAIWQNELGGITFRVRPTAVNPCVPLIHLAANTRYVKWQPAAPLGSKANHVISLAAEAERLTWARQWALVPEVLDYHRVGGESSDSGLGAGKLNPDVVVPENHEADGEILVTQALAGRPAMHAFWRARPAEAARAVGAGLRKLHDALPVADCPFDWSVSSRIERAGLAGTPLGDELLAAAPSLTDLVVCHGDACVPNTLLDNFGYLAGHVDFGRLGVADRWADIAVAAWSTEWNYGHGYADALYAGYGIAPDNEKIAYYQRLWDQT